MSKMDKKTVIYGGDTEKVSVDKVNWSKVESAIQEACGEDVKIINLSDAKTSVAEGRKGKKSAKTYVKIGLVGKDLVMRVKTPGVITDTEVDTILVRNAKALIEQKKSAGSSAKSSTAPSVDKSLLEEAEEHMELRAKMVEATDEFRKHTEDVLGELQTKQRSVEKFLNELKTEKGTQQRGVLLGTIGQIVEQAREQVRDLQKEYKAVTRSGSPLMESRRDFRGVSKLPSEDQGPYKTESGRLFRTASKTMEVVADNMNTVSYLSGWFLEGLEQGEALAGRVMDPTQALVRIGDIRSDLEALKDGIERRHGKLVQVLDRQNSVWQTVLNGDPSIKPQRIKSFEGKVEEIDKLVTYLRETREPLKGFNRRLAAIPGEAMLNSEVAKAADELRQTISALRLLHQDVPNQLKIWTQLRQDAETALT